MLERALAAYRLELRLTCWQWGYAALLVLWSAFVLASFRSTPSPQAMLLSTLNLSVIPFLSIGVLFLAAISASRPQRSRFDVLEWALPTGAEIVIARWLAIVTATLPFVIAPLAIAVTSGALVEFFATLPTFLLETLTVLALSSALVWLVGTYVGIKRWMYPLFGLIWLGSALFPTSLNAEVFPWSLLLSFSADAWNGYVYSAFWGRVTLGDLPTFANMFYLGALLLVIGVIAERIMRERRYRLSPPALIVTLAGLAIVLIGGVGYSAQVGVANAQRAQIGTQQINHDLPASRITPADVTYVPTHYDLTLDLSDFDTPTFTLQLDVANHGDAPLTDLPFVLNSQFEIVGASVAYERDDDDLNLHLPTPLAPGEATSIDLTYRGPLWWYGASYVQGRPRYALDFIKPEGVNLSCSVAWYPLPGHNVVGSLTDFTEDRLPDCVLAAPAAFDLRLAGVDDSPLRWGSNLALTDDPHTFSGTATWAHLLAAPNLVDEQLADGVVTLIAPEPLIGTAESAVTESYAPALAYFQRVFPDVDHLTVFATDAGFGTEFDAPVTPASDGNLVVVVRPFDLTIFNDNAYGRYEEIGKELLKSLFGRGYSRFTANTLINNVSFYLWIDFLTDGDADQMFDYLANDLPQGGNRQYYFSQPPSERYLIAHALYDVYVAQGETAVMDVIRQIRTDADQLEALTPEQVVAWIEETAQNAN